MTRACRRGPATRSTSTRCATRRAKSDHRGEHAERRRRSPGCGWRRCRRRSRAMTTVSPTRHPLAGSRARCCASRRSRPRRGSSPRPARPSGSPRRCRRARRRGSAGRARRRTSRAACARREARTLIIVWPIIAQPAMPPKKPVTTLAMPCPRASRSLSERRLGDVVDELRRHQRLQQADGGERDRVRRDDRSVSSVNGTDGRPSTGSALGQLALVADVRHVDARRRPPRRSARRSRPAAPGSPS